MLYEILSLVHWVAQALQPSGPITFDESQLEGLRPRTVQLYRIQVKAFVEWTDQRHYVLTFPQELDRAL